MLNIKVVTWSLAIWTTFSFVFCVVYGLLTPSGVHMTSFLEQVLPGFQPNSWRGFPPRQNSCRPDRTIHPGGVSEGRQWLDTDKHSRTAR
jgi:hypothetical protein